MTFNPFSGIINSDFKNLHANAITELVTGCAVPCTLVYGQTLFTDCPNCWEAGTPIRTEYGYKPIEDIKVGDRVYNANYGISTVLNTNSRLYSGEFIRIQCWSSSLPHYVTANHKFPVVRNFKKHFTQKQWCNKEFILNASDFVEEIPASDITLDDALIIPYSTHSDKDLKYWYEYEIDDDLLFFMGWWIAEGCLRKPKNKRAYQGSFCLCASKEENIAYKLLDILEDKFGIIGKLEYRKDADNLLVNWGSAKLAEIMMDFGHRAENKHIPDNLWTNLSLNQKYKILLAYLAGDGHICNLHDKSIYDRCSITTVSEQLSLQIFDILMSSGYYPSITYKDAYIDKNSVNHQRSYTVVWMEDRRQQKSNVRKSDLGWLVKVKQITKKYDTKYVYNLHIDGIHKYVASNYWTNNCLLNVVGNKSSNRYQAGGPTPFVGICPVCNGAGKIPTEQTASIDLAIIYDYREWINIGIEIGSPLGYVQSLSLLKTLDDLKEAKELIVDTNISKYVNQRFERVGEPQPCGFGQATIVVTMWKRIES